MNSWKNFTFLALLFSGSIVFAKASFVGMSGVSGQAVATDGTTYLAYAGYNGTVGGCSSPSGATCDSCSGATTLINCNHNSIYPSLRFHVNLRTDTTNFTTTPTVLIKSSGSTTGTISTGTSGYATGGDFYFDISWTDLLTAVGQSETSTFSNTLTIGLTTDGTSHLSGETVSVKIVYSYVDGGTTSNHQKCDPDSGGSGGSNDGFCFVDILAGDSKVYATRTNVASTFPTAGSASDLKWNTLVFFYESGSYLDTSGDSTMLGNITSASQYATISYDNANSPPTFDPRITGLSNDSRYCFIMANQDVTGNITNFTKLTDYSSQDQSSLFCAHPDEVFGLLDDKKCFIATAAWGSSLNPHVSTLRTFRDQFLKTNSLGRSFVQFYYDHSPNWAQYISNHDHLRAVARVGLWPLVGFANLSLALGLSGAIAVLLFFLAAGVGGVLVIRRKFGKNS